ncbi:excisionase [Neptunomonas sp. XY-337]|uniref:excisionase n=1 Tax=Neptunomonas sp. XY-337 TaxID=2561897 RepID=UPI0010AB35CC|nr:excisionase [Neptunomonas sp. XY-337]
MLITLSEWDKATYSKPHHINTLRTWAKEGRFKPAAEKHGREWLVQEGAKLVTIDRSRINLLRKAHAMREEEIPTELDPKVLEILSHGSTTQN